MGLCQSISHLSTTDTSIPHLCYSQLLNSHFNPHCHLPAGMAFVNITAPCSKNGYVPLYLCLPPSSQPRVWMDLQPYSETHVFFISPNRRELQFNSCCIKDIVLYNGEYTCVCCLARNRRTSGMVERISLNYLHSLLYVVIEDSVNMIIF